MLFSQSMPELHGLRCAKYIRCSHEDQVLHGDTLEAQDEILDDFITRNHLILVDTFIDEALTARKKYTKRKEFVRLLDGVRRHDFDLIIFTKLDRWFRNIADYHKIQEILEANNVQWKAVTESYDTTTTNGRLHINIRLSVAQDECDRDSDRIKDVFSYKLRNKTYLSGSLPRGLMLDEGKHVVIDPEWKQFALDMFDHFEATNSKRGTLLYLKEKYDMYLCYDTIARCLRNPLYKGEYRGDPEFCEPLIPPDRFDRIQLLGKRNVRERSTHRKYIFSGLLICTDCDHYLVAHTTVNSSKNKRYEYTAYRCNQHYQSHSCPRNKTFREEYVEDYLVSHVRPALADYVAEYEVSGASPAQKNPAAEAARIRTKLKKLYELYSEDLIDIEMYRSEYATLQKKLEEATSAAASSAHRDLDDLKEILSQGWEEIYKTFSAEEKAAFWKSFIQSVRVREDGEMDITFL